MKKLNYYNFLLILVIVIVFSVQFLMFGTVGIASDHKNVTATVSADDGTYTDALASTYKGKAFPVNISVYGASAWVATLYLERRFTSSGTWMVIKQYSATDAVSNSIQEQLKDPEPAVQYRLGCASGNYTSGTISLRLSR